jgi:hypothetical protein
LRPEREEKIKEGEVLVFAVEFEEGIKILLIRPIFVYSPLGVLDGLDSRWVFQM